MGNETTELVWSAPIPFDGGRADAVPHYGVYRLMLVDSQGQTIPVIPLQGIDQQSVLYVGCTKYPPGKLANRFESRREPYLKALRDKLHDQWLFWTDLQRVYCDAAGIQFEFVKRDSFVGATVLGARLHADYSVKFLEVPESDPKKPHPRPALASSQPEPCLAGVVAGASAAEVAGDQVVGGRDGNPIQMHERAKGG
jgi:hypothetical protein